MLLLLIGKRRIQFLTQSRSKRQAEQEGLLQSRAEGCTSPCRSTLSLNTGSELAEGLAEISSFKTSLIPCAGILAVH